MHYHIISIGGSAMHGLAIELAKQGHIVTGSDDEIFEPSLSRLKQYNLLPDKYGWFPEKITKEIDAVIVGMHAKIDNPEYLKAKKLNIKCYSYPEFIYNHSKNKKRIVIAGSYGKTTITAIIMHALSYAGIEFDYVIGSYVEGFDNTIRLSEAPIIIIEGDEYLSAPFDLTPKFVHYKPHVALINGISWDHVNVFDTFEKYLNAFSEFIDRIEENGFIIYNKDDLILSSLVNRKDSSKFTIIPYSNFEHKIENNKWKIIVNDRIYPVNLIGKHNMINIAGAYNVCKLLNIDENDFFNSLSTFQGARKRLQKLLDSDKLIIFLDFAHSPIKVKATIEAVKNTYSDFTLIAVLELHTYSSLQKNFLPQYKNTMIISDKAFVYVNPNVFKLKNYPLIEKEFIINSFNQKNLEVYYDTRQLFKSIKSSINNKTVILLMSSGNFNNFNIFGWINEIKTI